MQGRARRKQGKPPATRRVCILTAGGDAPGLNAVLRAFVKTASRLGIEVYGSEDGFEGLIHDGRLVPLTPATVRGILPKGGSILGCSNRANPYAYPIRDARGRERVIDVHQHVIERVKANRIDALVLVGGDGTMHHGVRLQEAGVPIIGIPKTIDNDLSATDVTFGFGTALDTATRAIDALHATAESHDRVMLVEVMGRDAGWIALCSGIAGGADVIVIPEIPYDVKRIVKKLERRGNRGSTFSIVVVGEGARPRGGKRSTLTRGKRGHLPRLGGAAHVLADQLEGLVAHEVRVTVLGHLLRGGTPSAFDRLLATRYGVRAAQLCAEGKLGVMVALHGTEIVAVPLADSIREPKLVPTHGELVDVARSLDIELG